MKITTKTTKEQLKDFLGANVLAVRKADKALYDRIAYADKMAKKDDSSVSRKDLVDLAKEVIALLGKAVAEPVLAQETPAPAEPKAENSVKKPAKGVSKKQETKEDDVETAEESQETTAKTTEKVDEKKSAKKSLGGKKKEAPKKDGVTALEDSGSQKTVQLAKQFPPTLTVGDVNYKLAEDINSMEDLYDALSKDEEVMFAYYWSKRHLKQFPYFGGLLGQPKSFDYDLDICDAGYISDELKVAYCVSKYTEAFYTVLPTDFDEEDGVRVAGGIEFQIYRAI